MFRGTTIQIGREIVSDVVSYLWVCVENMTSLYRGEFSIVARKCHESGYVDPMYPL